LLNKTCLHIDLNKYKLMSISKDMSCEINQSNLKILNGCIYEKNNNKKVLIIVKSGSDSYYIIMYGLITMYE
jgi:hypothetical protein